MKIFLILRSVFVIASILGLTLAGSQAIFTDSFEVDENVFTAGEVDISALPDTAAITMANMKPGDSATGVISVVNSGSLAFSYDLAAKKDAGISEFYNSLTAKVEQGRDVLYDGLLVDLLSLSTGRRSLDPGNSEDLTVTVGLPLEAGTNLSKKYTTVAFGFTAEQL